MRSFNSQKKWYLYADKIISISGELVIDNNVNINGDINVDNKFIVNNLLIDERYSGAGSTTTLSHKSLTDLNKFGLYFNSGGYTVLNSSNSSDCDIKIDNIPKLKVQTHNTSIYTTLALGGSISLPNNFSIQTVGSSSNYRNLGNNGFSLLKQIFFRHNNIDIFAVTENGDLQHRGAYLGSQQTTYSDDRLKHNESNITNGLEVIRLLQPQKYQKTRIMLDKDYNGDLNEYEWFWEAGFIAQDILTINDISYSITGGDYYDASNNLIEDSYRLNYNNIFTYTTAAVKELDVIVQAQENKINEQNTRIQELENKVQSQETLINQLISRIEALENS